MGVDRRNFIKMSAGAAAVGAVAGCGTNAATGGSSQSSGPGGLFADLRPMTDGIVPISDDERQGRMDKARSLMVENGMDVVVIEDREMTYDVVR